jgi:hypothetical protein
MLETHPEPIADRGDILACIEACSECAQACTACADACLGEPAVDELRACIRLNLDCTVICIATGELLSRIAAGVTALRRAQLHACVVACRACAEECRLHDYEFCRVCAETCECCAQACRTLAEQP